MEYNKIALDTPDLLAVLKQRGLQVSNDKETGFSTSMENTGNPFVRDTFKTI